MTRMINQGKRCTELDCAAPAHCKGLCVKHHNKIKMRKWRYGRVHLIRREKGTGSLNKGYVLIGKDWKRKGEHILIAEKALGRQLPKGAVVHHVDRNRSNNTPTNLVVCPNQAYHLLLHKRMRDRALAENGEQQRSR